MCLGTSWGMSVVVVAIEEAHRGGGVGTEEDSTEEVSLYAHKLYGIQLQKTVSEASIVNPG